MEPSWGTSDNEATTVPRQPYKVYTRSYDSGLSTWEIVDHVVRCQGSCLGARRTVARCFSLPFGCTIVTLHIPPVAHDPWPSSVQAFAMQGKCACA